MTASEAEKYPEILADLREALVELLTEAGAPPQVAADLAGAAAERIRCRWGGMAVYIPKGRDAQERRDYEIYRRFTGYNRQELCREYGLSEQRLYQIVARVRSEEIAKRQLKLF